MKYHHLERCFTHRMKRSKGLGILRGVHRQGLGFTGGSATFTRWGSGRQTSLSLRPQGPCEDPTVQKRAQIELGLVSGSRVLFRDICQMGSLAGAAYLLHDNAGVLRQAQWEQKSHVAHKRKGLLD